jgi:hypothetical protein
VSSFVVLFPRLERRVVGDRERGIVRAALIGLIAIGVWALGVWIELPIVALFVVVPMVEVSSTLMFLMALSGGKDEDEARAAVQLPRFGVTRWVFTFLASLLLHWATGPLSAEARLILLSLPFALISWWFARRIVGRTPRASAPAFVPAPTPAAAGA